MDLNRIAQPAVALVGFAALVAGIAVIHWPTALIVAGALLLLFGLFVIDDGREDVSP
jgi:hypothetical protein